jgi:hypothetical protein
MTRLPDPPDTLVVKARDWSTPLTGKEYQWGDARLKGTTYARGLYPMEGIGGHEFMRVAGPGRLPVTMTTPSGHPRMVCLLSRRPNCDRPQGPGPQHSSTAPSGARLTGAAARHVTRSSASVRRGHIVRGH